MEQPQPQPCASLSRARRAFARRGLLAQMVRRMAAGMRCAHSIAGVRPQHEPNIFDDPDSEILLG